MKKTALALLLAFASLLATAQLNMSLLDQIDYTANTNDIWGWVDPDNGKEYALVGLVTGVSIVDVSNPQNIAEVQFIPGPNSTWRDLKTWGNFAYVTNESSGGVLVINLSGAPNNITWTNWQPDIPGLGPLNRCHNLYIDEFGYCYLAGCNINSGGIVIADVFTNPGSPVYVGKAPAVYAHDAYARNNVLYASEIYKGTVTLYDVTNKQNITGIASQPTPYAFTHNAWLNDAGDVVFTTDEKANAPIAAFDISNPSSITLLDQFRPLATLGTNVIPHNVHVWNDWLIISYYTDGGIIADASRPENIIEVGNWDTFLGGSGFSGAWGAYPFLPSGNVLLTDIGNGLFVCGANYVRACWLEGKVTNAITGAPVGNASVSIASAQVNTASSDLVGNYKTGQAIPGVFDVTFTATGYYPKTVPATLENGVLTLLDVALEPLVINQFPAFGYSSPTSGCGPLTVSFTENTSIVAAWQWTFENGTPATSNLQNPVVEFDSPGTHSVSLQVVTLGGNTYNIGIPDLISVAPDPIAAFEQSVTDTTATFSNTSENYTSAHWDFGDNNTSTDLNPTHDYAQPGTYNVSLIVTGDCGTDTTTQAVTIIPFAPSANFGTNVVAGCAPLTVTFTDQSTNSPTTWAWSFPGGSPATSTEQHPTVTYDNAGTYGVELLAANAGGSGQMLQTDLITVVGGPSANFSASSNGLQAQFANSSTGANTVHWDFGDSNSSTDLNPTHDYAQPGTYQVSLVVTGDCGTDTTTQAVTIIPFAPSAGFGANVVAGCAPLTVIFTDQSTNSPTTWAWSFPGGSPATSTDQHPTVTYNNAGTYGVELLAANAGGSGQLLQTDLITVVATPAANFSASINGPQVQFANSTTGAGTAHWDFGDGQTSDELNPLHTYDLDGDYTAVLTMTNICGTSTHTSIISISAFLPVASFNADLTAGCAPLTVAFNDLSTGAPLAWQWSFPGGNPATSFEQNPVVIYDNAGIYSATLEVENTWGSGQTNQTDLIIVNTVPSAIFDYSVNGLMALFVNNSMNAINYEWIFNDGTGATSTEFNPTHTFPAPGIYEVVLNAMNECGTVAFTQKIIIPAIAPEAAFTAGNTQGCAPLVVHFTDQSTNAPTAWEWTFPGGNPATSTEQNPIVTYDAPGTYEVSLTTSNAGGSSFTTQSDLVVVDDVPQVAYNFTVNETTVAFTNSSLNATTYAWDFGDGLGSSNEANPVYTYADAGNYEVTLIASNDCGDVELAQTVQITANATNDRKINGHTWSAFPNPFNSELWLDYELVGRFETAVCIVTNTLGEEIVRIPLMALKGTLALGDEINGSGLFFLYLLVDGKNIGGEKIVRL